MKPFNPHALRSKVDVFCDLQTQRELIAEYVQEIEAKNAALGQQLAEIKKLQGLIPICCCCKKIRNEDGYWQQVEVYIERHSDAQFTHGYCCGVRRTAHHRAARRGRFGLEDPL